MPSVEGCVLESQANKFIRTFELSASDSCLEVGKSVVKSGDLHRVLGIESSVSPKFSTLTSSDKHSSFAGGDNFVAIERIASNVSRSDPESFTGILDDGYGDVTRYFARLSIQMHYDNSFRSEGNFLSYLLPIHSKVAIYQRQPSANILDHRACSSKGHGRNDYFVSTAYAH